jgi:hypothetical protein
MFDSFSRIKAAFTAWPLKAACGPLAAVKTARLFCGRLFGGLLLSSLLLSSLLFSSWLLSGPALALEADPAAMNPHPDPLDFSLPLPCGLSMAFRTAAVPARALLSDLELSLGGGGDYAESLVSRPHLAFVASSLTVNELPEPYRAAAAQAMAGQASAQLYLIGKYEVTSAQWAAVMEGCEAGPENPRLPKTGISWFEAVRFTERLMSWLVENDKAALPQFAGDSKEVGLVRLPTESEWEYAARGAQAAPPGALASDALWLAEGEAVEASGVRGPEISAIGRRKPRSQGLHDTAGNAAERTTVTFRMTVAKRLHGAHGGVTVKGGSHLDEPGALRPGRRLELPFFDNKGPAKSPVVGLRLVISAINVPGGRMGELQSEFVSLGERMVASLPEDDWGVEGAQPGEPQKAAEPEPAPASPLRDTGPTDRIKALIEEVSEPTHKEALADLLDDVEKAALAREERTFAEVQDKCVSLLYAAWGIRDTSLRRALVARRLQHLQNTEAELPAQMSKNIDAQERAQLAQMLEQARAGQAPLQAELPQYDRSLGQQFNYYKALLFDLNDYDRNLVLAALDATARSLQGADPLTVSMNRSLAIVVQDVKFVLAGRNDQLDLGRLMVRAQ